MSLNETQEVLLKEKNGNCLTETLILDENKLVEKNVKDEKNIDLSPAKNHEIVNILKNYII